MSHTPVPILYLFIVGRPEKNPEEWLEFLRSLGTNPDRQPVEVRSCFLVVKAARLFFDLISRFSHPFCSVACLFQLLDKESLKLPFSGREEVASKLWEITSERYAAVDTGDKEKHTIPFYVGQPGIGK